MTFEKQMQGQSIKMFRFKTIVLVAAVLTLGGWRLLSSLQNNEGDDMTESKPALPQTVGLWTRPKIPMVVTAENIFDYMNGAGELYLGYRFDHCDVYQYQARSQKEILVELYHMETADDAFGLLSLDWGGEPVDPSGNPGFPHMLYGEGLLRVWSGKIYARIMAVQETPESREAVLTIGRAVDKDRRDIPVPPIMEKLPDSFLKEWILRSDRAGYFRTHLVLNSLYYLSHQNILELDLACAAVTARYEKTEGTDDRSRIQFLWIEYPDPKRARSALARFHAAYLPEHSSPAEPYAPGETAAAVPIEDGWMSYRLRGESLFFVFECPDEKTARAIMDELR